MSPEVRPRDPLLVDGDLQAELTRRGVEARPTPGAAPPPIREPEAVRRLLIEIARAGADVLTAPTAGTHRRALARLGEARRTREWTLATVELTREASVAAADAAEEEAARTPPEERPLVRIAPPRLAGLLAPLEDRDVPELAPDETTALGEHRAQAGLLADAGTEIIRIEGMGTIREAHAATVAATELNLEVWSGVALDSSGVRLRSGEPLEAWFEAILPLEPEVLVVEGPTARAVEAALGQLRGSTSTRMGASVDGDLPPDSYGDALQGWLTNGAGVVGCGQDGEPRRVSACRAVLDSWIVDHHAAAEALHATRSTWLLEGVRRAAAGDAAIVVAAAPADIPLDDLAADLLRYEGPLRWHVVPPGNVLHLPPGHFQLCVASAGGLEPDALFSLVTALAPGGWLLLGGVDQESALVRRLAADERVESLHPTDSPPGPGMRGWLSRRRP